MKKSIIEACTRITQTGTPEFIRCLNTKAQSFRVTLNTYWNKSNDTKISARYNKEKEGFILVKKESC